jgi:hypothetical protein
MFTIMKLRLALLTARVFELIRGLQFNFQIQVSSGTV